MCCDYRAQKSVVTVMWTAGGYPKQCSRFSGRGCTHTTLIFHLRLSVRTDSDGKRSDHSVPACTLRTQVFLLPGHDDGLEVFECEDMKAAVVE